MVTRCGLGADVAGLSACAAAGTARTSEHTAENMTAAVNRRLIALRVPDCAWGVGPPGGMRLLGKFEVEGIDPDS